MISERAEINVWDLIQLANKHPRVNILTPGPGVGGHCIAVDPWFLVNAFPKETKIIKAAREVNLFKTEWVIEKVNEKVADFKKATGRNPIVACMGLAYKPDIDDLRESPAVEITEKLIQQGNQVITVEPNIEKHPRFVLTDYNEVVNKADIFVLLVKHKEFKNLSLTSKIVVDVCGI